MLYGEWMQSNCIENNQKAATLHCNTNLDKSERFTTKAQKRPPGGKKAAY